MMALLSAKAQSCVRYSGCSMEMRTWSWGQMLWCYPHPVLLPWLWEENSIS